MLIYTFVAVVSNHIKSSSAGIFYKKKSYKIFLNNNYKNHLI